VDCFFVPQNWEGEVYQNLEIFLIRIGVYRKKKIIGRPQILIDILAIFLRMDATILYIRHYFHIKTNKKITLHQRLSVSKKAH